MPKGRWRESGLWGHIQRVHDALSDKSRNFFDGGCHSPKFFFTRFCIGLMRHTILPGEKPGTQTVARVGITWSGS